MRRPSTKKKVNPINIWTILAVIACLYAIATGQWIPAMNGRITEMYVCKTDTELRPATAFYTDVLYICGIVEGTSPAWLGFYFFCNGNNVFTDNRKVEVGEFFISSRYNRPGINLPEGVCRVTVQYDRKVVHEVEFAVTER